MAVVLATTWSFGSFVVRDNGDTPQQRAVTWARNHHLGPLVDFAERHRYGKAPSRTEAATDLSLREVNKPAPVGSALPAAPAAPIPTTTVAEAVPTTIPAWRLPPESVSPRVAEPIEGEGRWTAIASAAGFDAVWATSLRPLAEYPSVVGTFAVVDQTNLHAALFNGSDIPGGNDWSLPNRVMPDHLEALTAAFNGGFRFEHIKGGYKTEGRVVRELVPGEATLAIDRKGTISIGEFGRDIFDDGTYISLRQNLPLLVDNGVANVQRNSATWWGGDFDDVIFVIRSAVCLRADGRLMYGVVAKVDAELLATSLVEMGCARAMQLDINGTWPTFQTFVVEDDGKKHGVFVDTRMSGNRDRYIDGSTREFVALFDRALLPPEGAVALNALRGLDLAPTSPPAT